MLGQDLARTLAAAGYEVRPLARRECDVLVLGDLAAAVDWADVIVNCAAYTAVDRAESERDRAYAINADAVGRLGELATAKGRYVLHISTDFVYDGAQSRPYVETDATAPLSVYGASKLAGEQLLAASGCQHATVRVEWTYGEYGDNFISKILARARSAGSLTVVDDQVGAPSSTRQIATVLQALLRDRAEGLYLYADAGYASRYEVAQFIVQHLGMDVPVTPCPSSTFVSPAARPLNSRFDCARLDATLSLTRPHWRDTLGPFLDTCT